MISKLAFSRYDCDGWVIMRVSIDYNSKYITSTIYIIMYLKGNEKASLKNTTLYFQFLESIRLAKTDMQKDNEILMQNVKCK